MLIKLTDENHQTRGGTQWGEGVTHAATGKGTAICTEDVIHVYEGPLTAAFMYPVHVTWRNPVAWECEAEIVARDGSLKTGARTVTTLRRVPLPQLSPEVRARVAIMCTKVVYSDATWNAWADRWLSGEDQSEDAALAAAWASEWAGQAAVLAAKAVPGLDLEAIIEQAIADEEEGIRARVAIMCTKVVYSDATWNAWADRWLSGEDRSQAIADEEEGK